MKIKDKHVYVNNQKKLMKSAQVWDLEVVWHDGNTFWLPLEDLKNLNLMEVAKHASTIKIDREVTFNW